PAARCDGSLNLTADAYRRADRLDGEGQFRCEHGFDSSSGKKSVSQPACKLTRISQKRAAEFARIPIADCAGRNSGEFRYDTQSPGSDGEIDLAAQNAVDQFLRQVDGDVGRAIEIGGVDSAVHGPRSQVPPAAGALRFFGKHGSRAAIAPDGGVSLLVQR